MATVLLVLLAVPAVTVADQRSHVLISVGAEGSVQYAATAHRQPLYQESQLAYGYHPQPAYGHPQPTYYPQPVYYQQATYHSQPTYHHQPAVPACAANTTETWCLEDPDYPEYEINHALQYNVHHVLALYADVAGLSTPLSVERPKTLKEETYLCSSETSYVKPLRAINTDGKWRVIVNNVNVHYQTLTQTTRIEECLTSGDACPLVPECYESKCLQKSIYHRFLVYDPYDQYFPFAIETFKLPASCACLLGAYTIDH
ncbi:neurotrophin 1-like [Panulirus ornatus]|uniref:neurotrophin 1-like n=1 Tax=Panulirus ornatus TaxID=150431 RepID=UPI003A891FC3